MLKLLRCVGCFSQRLADGLFSFPFSNVLFPYVHPYRFCVLVSTWRFLLMHISILNSQGVVNSEKNSYPENIMISYLDETGILACLIQVQTLHLLCFWKERESVFFFWEVWRDWGYCNDLETSFIEKNHPTRSPAMHLSFLCLKLPQSLSI